MIFQLTVYSLLLLFLTLVGQFMAPGGGRGGRQQFGGSRSMADQGERVNALIRDVVRMYVLFAPYALLLYLQGKPDLLPQYLGWVFVVSEVLRGGALFTGRVAPARFLGLISAAVLAFLWLQELPIFQARPA